MRAASGDGQLVAAVLADELAGELLAHLEPGGSGGELPRAAQRVAARARVLAAVRAQRSADKCCAVRQRLHSPAAQWGAAHLCHASGDVPVSAGQGACCWLSEVVSHADCRNVWPPPRHSTTSVQCQAQHQARAVRHTAWRCRNAIY